MRKVVLLYGICFGLGFAPVRAGSVNVLGNAPETDGKLTLQAGAIQVDGGSSPTQINLPDVLEADFGDTPLHLEYFAASGDKAKQLPPEWKGQDIGQVTTPGSFSYANGTFTVQGNGTDDPYGDDVLYFVGQPWTGDGQWTVRLKEIDGNDTGGAEAGLMIRRGMDPEAVQFGLGTNTQSNFSLRIRHEAGKALDIRGYPTQFDLPVWMRFTRRGDSLIDEVSQDGKTWNSLRPLTLKDPDDMTVGFFVNSHKTKVVASAVFDQVTFSPPPAHSGLVPRGILLCSGSILAGHFDYLGFEQGSTTGNFNRNGKLISTPSTQVAAVAFNPTKVSQIVDAGGKPGVILKNGDVVAGDVTSLGGEGASLTSVLLGPANYTFEDAVACVLNPLLLQPSDYEVRLKDGSIIRATTVDANADQINIGEVSGLTITASPDELAQIRAGSSHVQNLLELSWKAAAVPPTTPVALEASVPKTASDLDRSVQTWVGSNQEQILVAAAGMQVDFPLTDKFRALALKVAVAPDAVPHAEVIIRVLADGREIGRSPPFKAGDPPRFVEVAFQDPKIISLVTDSATPGTKALFIDPVAIRDN